MQSFLVWFIEEESFEHHEVDIDSGLIPGSILNLIRIDDLGYNPEVILKVIGLLDECCCLEEVKIGMGGGVLLANLFDEEDSFIDFHVVVDRHQKGDDGVQLFLVGQRFVEDVVEEGLQSGLVREVELFYQQVQHLQGHLIDL